MALIIHSQAHEVAWGVGADFRISDLGFPSDFGVSGFGFPV